MNPFVVHPPSSKQTATGQQAVYSLTAIPQMKLNHSPHLLEQLAVLVKYLRLVTLRTTGLFKYPASSSLGNLFWPQTLADGIDRPSPALGAYKFGRAASFRISMSSAWSATNRFSLAFSFCSS